MHYHKFNNGRYPELAQNVLCLHLLIRHCVCGSRNLCRDEENRSVNLALGERFSTPVARVPAAVSQTRDCECSVERPEEYSTILADPRCVLNIKSSAVIPLAAPNTNRGLPVAMATALLSNIASSGSASLSVSLFSSLLPCSSLCHLPCCFIFVSHA